MRIRLGKLRETIRDVMSEAGEDREARRDAALRKAIADIQREYPGTVVMRNGEEIPGTLPAPKRAPLPPAPPARPADPGDEIDPVTGHAKKLGTSDRHSHKSWVE